MKRNGERKLAQSAICLVCLIVQWGYGFALAFEGTEFSGGWLSGRLLHLYDIGALLFVIALLLTFFYQGIAAAVIVLASLFCLPLCLFFTAPGPFRRVFSGVYFEGPLHASFVWNTKAVLGILTFVVAAGVAVSGFLVPAKKASQSSA